MSLKSYPKVAMVVHNAVVSDARVRKQAKTLRDAQSNPEDYRHLVVRVAGYSAYFTELDRGLQDEIIRRTEFTQT